MTDRAITHGNYVTEVADEYRRRGYDVVVEPPASELPLPIGPFRPDVLARNSVESVLIEVRSKVSDNKDLVRLAELVRHQPGWRFELVVYDSNDADPPRALVPAEQLILTLEQVTRLLAQRLDVPAYALLWTVTEAALRHSAAKRGVDETAPPKALFRGLSSVGAITDREVTVLDRAMVFRNRAVHGFDMNVDQKLIEELQRISRRLLTEARPWTSLSRRMAGSPRKVRSALASVVRCAAKRCTSGTVARVVVSTSRICWSSRPRALASPCGETAPAAARSRSASACCRCAWI